MFCGSCGAKLSTHARFCGECGATIETTTSVAQETPAALALEVDYTLYGDDIQLVEIGLAPGESVVAEAGAMTYMESDIRMSTIMGDGSSADGGKSLVDKLVSAGKRSLAGESIFMTVFQNAGSEKSHVAFAAPYPGKIIPVRIEDFGSSLICQKDAFLCAVKGIAIGIHIQKKLGVGFFGGEGFIMQKLTGKGLVFLHAGGMIIKKELVAGETLRLDTGCLVAISETVDYDVAMASDIKSGLFGGEGIFLATVKGPGHVWIQSLPFSRMADKIAHAGHTGENKGLNNPIGELAGGIGGALGGLFKS